MSAARTLVAAVAFVVVLIATFPTGPLVDRVLRTVAPGSVLTHGTVALRPWGLVLADVRVWTTLDAPPILVERLEIVPSLTGWLASRGGRPWRVTAHACGGEATAVVDGGITATQIALGWRELDLGRCALPPLAGGAVAGHAEGTASLSRDDDGRLVGDGRLVVTGASWPGAAGAGVGDLTADRATIHWRLAGRHLALDAIDLYGPALHAHGGGEVELAPGLSGGRVALRLALGGDGGLPERFVVVDGTLAQPRVAIP